MHGTSSPRPQRPLPGTRPRFFSIAAACLLGAVVPGQTDDDLRDIVVLTNGKELRGRIANRYSDEVLLMRGGSRKRIATEKVQRIETVVDRVRTFLDLRRRAPAHASARWTLVEWAKANELPEMARLTALDLVLRPPPATDPTAPPAPQVTAAHELLGHRWRKDRWLWPVGKRFVPLADWLKHHADWGREMELRSEHFVLRTSGGPTRAIDALFDLEALLLQVHQEFGEALRLDEVRNPIELRVWGEGDEFPAWSGLAIPYYVPHPFGDAALTRYEPGAKRPLDLVAVATQAILYRCLTRGAPLPNQQSRFATWAEIGLGQWLQWRSNGDPGAITFGHHNRHPKHTPQSLAARRSWGIEDVIHFSLRDHFHNYLLDAYPMFWADAHMLVAFLMADDTLRPRFLEYLHNALAKGRGTSSSIFDKAIGAKVETLSDPWVRWLQSL